MPPKNKPFAVIIGGGPVGLTAAIELGQRDVPVLLLSQGRETSVHPKCNLTNARSMEQFRRLGIAADIRACGLPPSMPPDIVYMTRFSGREIHRHRFPPAAMAAAHYRAHPDGWLTPEPQHRVSQIFLERVLKQTADSLASAEIRFGWQAELLAQNDDSVQVRATELATGHQEVIDTRYLLACDGGRSQTRRDIGVSMVGEGGVDRAFLGGRMLAVYFRSAGLAQLLPADSGFMFWAVNRERRSVLVRIDGRDQFLTHFQLSPAQEPSVEDAVAMVRQGVGAPVDMEILSMEPWTAGLSLVADRFRSGRVFLAGDSAHLFTPTGGFGMNTGLEDVANLCWKLAAVHDGWAGERLLDSYELECRPVAVARTAYARSLADQIGHLEIPGDVEADEPAGTEGRAALAADLARIAVGEFETSGVQLGSRYLASPITLDAPPDLAPVNPTRYEPVSLPGCRLPHLYLSTGASLYDQLGRGFTLLRVGAAAAPDGFVQAAAARSLPLRVVVLAEEQAVRLYGHGLILIRPDQVIAWRGRDDRAAGKVLDRICCLPDGTGSEGGRP